MMRRNRRTKRGRSKQQRLEETGVAEVVGGVGEDPEVVVEEDEVVAGAGAEDSRVVVVHVVLNDWILGRKVV